MLVAIRGMLDNLALLYFFSSSSPVFQTSLYAFESAWKKPAVGVQTCNLTCLQSFRGHTLWLETGHGVNVAHSDVFFEIWGLKESRFTNFVEWFENPANCCRKVLRLKGCLRDSGRFKRQLEPSARWHWRCIENVSSSWWWLYLLTCCSLPNELSQLNRDQ